MPVPAFHLPGGHGLTAYRNTVLVVIVVLCYTGGFGFRIHGFFNGPGR